MVHMSPSLIEILELPKKAELCSETDVCSRIHSGECVLVDHPFDKR
jgi:hypothetical protein